MEISIPKLLIVDCFDSFTYNLHHYLEELIGSECAVIRYDDFNPEDSLKYSHVVLSPGPGLPEQYPLIQDFLNNAKATKVLGVCLGLQCMVEHEDGMLKQLKKVKHGVSSFLKVEGKPDLFKNLIGPIEIGHYHSWVADENSFPSSKFEITSRNTDGNIMSIAHVEYPWTAVQFHPESIMTPFGKTILKNWLLPKSS